MTRDVNVALKHRDGTPVQNGDKPLTVGAAVIDALESAVLPNERPSLESSRRRIRLADRIEAGGAVDLTPEDLALIKHCAGSHYVPRLAVQIGDWCDSDPAPAS